MFIVINFDGFAVLMFKDHVQHGAVGQAVAISENEDLISAAVDEPDEVLVVGCFKIPERFNVLKIAGDLLMISFGYSLGG
ncbi:hypothetical protein [Mucilaginibacter sp. AK015]|uniref:hypothetical protein n=1 Tax=Mucilaginibacter sp. AK015 TaxID=2723072 RepID=UPI0017FAEE37|nr:hypothetical protein [Mucilaginibacter sp. AK015]MBB5395056.1 hypothetical protein [Mucilaginibacter sp. AK015]